MMYVLCLSGAASAYTEVTTGDLRARGCDPIANADVFACQSAADLVCRDRGFRGGHGPVEWNDSMSGVVCFR
jgi:hypothetical protein